MLRTVFRWRFMRGPRLRSFVALRQRTLSADVPA